MAHADAQANASQAPIDCEALVIGAGPVGLFQVFQLGLQGVHAQVVDALPAAGGQCIELYADKPIYDIPALPVCTGRELVDRLLQQIAPFAPAWHLGQEVSGLHQRDDGRFDLATSSGQRFNTRCVFIAGGVGAFQPRKLLAEGVERLAADERFYRLPALAALAGRQVVVVGGDDGAVSAAVQLADALAQGRGDAPAGITLLHRRATLQADADLLARLQAHMAGARVHFQVGQTLELHTSTQPARLTGVQVIGDDSRTRRLPADALLVQLGISPKLGPIAHWGLAMERRQVVVDAARCETSTPGIYAVGDMVSYPGKKKLILCGFHEATLATFAALQRLRPEAPTQLQYTTTSALLQQRLGVAAPAQT